MLMFNILSIEKQQQQQQSKLLSAQRPNLFIMIILWKFAAIRTQIFHCDWGIGDKKKNIEFTSQDEYV